MLCWKLVDCVCGSWPLTPQHSPAFILLQTPRYLPQGPRDNETDRNSTSPLTSNGNIQTHSRETLGIATIPIQSARRSRTFSNVPIALRIRNSCELSDNVPRHGIRDGAVPAEEPFTRNYQVVMGHGAEGLRVRPAGKGIREAIIEALNRTLVMLYHTRENIWLGSFLAS